MAQRQGSDRPQGSYGIDAPWVPVLWLALGVVFLAGGVINTVAGGVSFWWIVGLVYFYLGAAVWFAGAALYLHATRRGKFAVWSELLEELGLDGDENTLDLGCGRGAVLVLTALAVPAGQATGVDLWRSIDQSGNSHQATERNLAANDVADRVRLETGDMTALPYADARFDLITASLSIHNVPTAAGRKSAILEAIRVLKPGGRLAIVDIQKIGEYRKAIEQAGLRIETDAPVGWRMWWSGPWVSSRILIARRLTQN